MKKLFFSIIVFSLIAVSCQTAPREFDANQTIEKIKQNSQSLPEIPPPIPNNNDHIIVLISEEGQIKLQHLGKEEIFNATSNINQFKARITEILENRQDKTVFLRASPLVQSQQIQQVINIIKQAKASPIGLQIEN